MRVSENFMKNILEKITKYAIYLLVFLMPIFFLPFSVEAYEFNKQFLLFALVSLGFFAWLLKMVAFDKEIRFKRTNLDIPVLIFMLVMTLSAVFSVDKSASVLGFYGRFSDGLIGVLSFGMMYFLITQNFSDQKSKLIKIFLGSTSVAVLMSYFSLFGIWVKINNQLLSISGNLSLPSVMLQKTFNPVSGSLEGFAIFLAVVVVMIAGRLLDKEKLTKTRPLSILAEGGFLTAILGLLVIIDFIAAWIVLALGLIFFLIFSLRTRQFKERINVLLLPIFLIIISLLFIFMDISILDFDNLPKEVLLDQSVSWNVAFQGLKVNPVLGSGLATFSHNFSKFRPVEFNQTSFWQLRFDRAGNHMAGIVTSAGILGILAWLLIIITAYKGNKENQAIFFVFIALVIAQFVYYQNTALMFMFWMVLAMMANDIMVNKTSKAEKIYFKKIKLPKINLPEKLSFKEFPELNLIFNVVLIIVGVGLLGLYYFAGRFYMADVSYAKGWQIESLEKAVELNPYQTNYRITLSQGYLQDILKEINKPTVEQDLEKITNYTIKAIQEAKLANSFSPKWIKTQEGLGIIYRDIRVIADDPHQLAIKSFEKAIVLEPTNPVFYTELGKLLILDEKNEEGKKQFEKAIELKSDYTDALFQIGLVYFNAGEVDQAIESFEKAVMASPRHSNSIYSLGVAYQKKGMNKQALEMFYNVLAINPGNQDVLKKIEELK